jgi:hypothetical protein
MANKSALKKEATAEIFSLAFDRLEKDEKLKVIEKLLENQSIKKDKNSILLKLLDNPSIREDLYDLALIEAAKKVKGKCMPLDEYLRKRKSQ